MNKITLELTNENGTFIFLEPNYTGKVLLPTDIEYREIGRLKEISEEQASEIVEHNYKGGILKCYLDYQKGRFSHSIFTATQSLYSFLRSKGYYVFHNPKPLFVMAMSEKGVYDTSKEEYDEAEQITFRNPLIIQKL